MLIWLAKEDKFYKICTDGDTKCKRRALDQKTTWNQGLLLFNWSQTSK